MHKLIRTYPTRSVKLARPRPLGAKLAEKDSTGREHLRRKNVKLEKCLMYFSSMVLEGLEFVTQFHMLINHIKQT